MKSDCPSVETPLLVTSRDGAVLSTPFDARQWVLVFLVLGIVIRLTHYLMQFPYWLDERAVVVNLINADYHRLTQALQLDQVAPIPWLWLERFMAVHLGFRELSLRLPAIIAGVASVVLFAHAARRLLAGAALILAVAVFAVAYYPVRYSAEVKPYGVDLLVSLVFVSLALEWRREPSRTRWLWVLAGVTPLALAISFPAIFVVGAISCALVVPVWRGKKKRTLWPFLTFNTLALGSFLLLTQIYLKLEYSGVRQASAADWDDAFPPVFRAGALVSWFIRTFTGDLMAYPVGGNDGAGTHALLALGIGLTVLWRKDRRWFVTLTLGMFLFGLLASAMRLYPLAYHPRFTMYLAPVICLGVGLGVAQAIAWLRSPVWRRRVLCGVLILSCALGVGYALRDVTRCYKGSVDQIHRGFARWFWTECPDMQDVCVTTDMCRNIYEDTPDKAYLCYRAMFGRLPSIAFTNVSVLRVSTPQTVRCVLFHEEGSPRKDEEFAAWMSEMTTEYTLDDHLAYRVQSRLVETNIVGIYEVYYFLPRDRHLPKARGANADPG